MASAISAWDPARTPATTRPSVNPILTTTLNKCASFGSRQFCGHGFGVEFDVLGVFQGAAR